MNQATHPSRPGPRAFSLIEVLVVIAIIALLAGIGVVVAANMRVSIKRNNTEMVLATLATTLTEYQAQTNGQSPNPGSGDIADFVTAVKDLGDQNPAVTVLKTIDSAYWDPAYNETDASLVDPWGTKLQYFPPAGINGVVTSANQQPIRQQPYFASAGPDGQWGEFTDGNIEDPVGDAAKDNLYSFNVGE